MRSAFGPLVCLVLASTIASAQPRSPSQTEQAAAHYQAGQLAYAEDRLEAALREFELGYALAPRPEFLINFAQVHRKLGRYGDAAIDCERYLATRPSAKMAEEVSRLLVAIREDQAEAMQGRGAAAAAAAHPTATPSPSTTPSLPPSPLLSTSTSTSLHPSPSTSTSTTSLSALSPAHAMDRGTPRRRVGLIVGLVVGGLVVGGVAVTLGVLFTRSPRYPAAALGGDFR